MTHLKLSSDTLHNQNCHAYLLKLKPFVNQVVVEYFPPIVAQLASLSEEYDPKIAYGDLYSTVISSLEDRIDAVCALLKKNGQEQEIEGLINAIYHNDNHILEQTYWVNELNLSVRPQNAHQVRDKIVHHLTDEETTVNQMTPQKADTRFKRINILYNFKPQTETNLPSIRHYQYNPNSNIHEYRISTQAQRHQGEVRISPLFMHWLKINAQKAPQKRFAHIYFNNLTLDNTNILDIPGGNEQRLSQELHKLEENSALKVAVITLPASKGLLGTKGYQITGDKIPYASIFEELLTIAKKETHPSKIADFKMSPEVRQQLWSTDVEQNQKLTELLKRSFVTMGFKESSYLSTAQKQAVWFHFIKMELPNYILTQLAPISYNFSCKDAIDRGVISSLYLHLMKSFNSDNPMQAPEFERELDSVAALVKGRGLNFHRQIIWNALDTYVNANYAQLISDSQKNWLIFWRDMNCPHARVNQLLATRIQQCTALLQSTEGAFKEKGMKLLGAIEQQLKQQVSGKRLLLEVVARTSQLLITPDIEHMEIYKSNIDAYKNLSQELQINHPKLQIIAGLMKAFLGLILLLPSLGSASSLITGGIATARAGFFASNRTKLCEHLEDLSDELDEKITPKLSD